MLRRLSAGQFVAGTYESCYGFLPPEYCGILIFFDGWPRAVWMDFRSEGTRRNVNLSTLLLRGLKAEQCDFGEKNCSGTGVLSEHGFHHSTLVLLLLGTVNGLLLRVEEHRTRHQNGMGKRVTLSLIYDKCMQPGSRNRDKLMHVLLR